MALRVETVAGRTAAKEFVRFRDRVYASRAVRWPSFELLDLPILVGEGPFAEGRRIHPLVVRDGDDIVARAAACIDGPYQRYWDEPHVGHFLFFEALPGTRTATRMLVDAACEWLAGQGVTVARAGMGLFEMPFVIDDYESLPPNILRHNPPYYHALLKEAAFETGRGFVDYRIRVRAELVTRWQAMIDAVPRPEFALVPLRTVPEASRGRVVADILNEAFRAHWGYVPTSAAEQDLLNRLFEGTGFLDTTVIAYHGEEPVGQCYVVPEASGFAATAPGRALRDEERLNFLGIGLRPSARGRGLATAMAAWGYVELARRGARWLSYTLVLDDNWPSRRTAEKLGAEVCANYVAYERAVR
jgi:RimJ/RimL family protein N-acetyltransferase